MRERGIGLGRGCEGRGEGGWGGGGGLATSFESAKKGKHCGFGIFVRCAFHINVVSTQIVPSNKHMALQAAQLRHLVSTISLSPVFFALLPVNKLQTCHGSIASTALCILIQVHS